MKSTTIVVSCVILLTSLFFFYNTPTAYADNHTPNVEEKIQKLGIKLTTPVPFKANFVHSVRTGNLVFLSGHISVHPEKGLIKGKVGSDLNIEQGKEAARWCAIDLLSSLKAEIGDLNKVQRIVKVTGMINATPDFTGHSQVINGCSDLLAEVFGAKKGKHARAAVGMNSLPLGVAVEIEMIVEVSD